MRVVLLASAEHDLKELRRYIVKVFSVATWKNTYDKLKKSIGHLPDFPLLGGIPEELEALNSTQYRQILSGRNRIIYEIRQDTVFIHVIVDIRRDMVSFLMTRLVR
jgi:toxin ParE1/3/4